MRTKKGKWVSSEAPANCCLGCVHFRRGDSSYRTKEGKCRKHPVIVPVDFDYRCSEFEHDGTTGEYWVRREEDSVKWFQMSDKLIEAQRTIISDRKDHSEFRKEHESWCNFDNERVKMLRNRGLWARIWNR
jgi:hypothetical protein